MKSFKIGFCVLGFVFCISNAMASSGGSSDDFDIVAGELELNPQVMSIKERFSKGSAPVSLDENGNFNGYAGIVTGSDYKCRSYSAALFKNSKVDDVTHAVYNFNTFGVELDNRDQLARVEHYNYSDQYNGEIVGKSNDDKYFEILRISPRQAAGGDLVVDLIAERYVVDGWFERFFTKLLGTTIPIQAIKKMFSGLGLRATLADGEAAYVVSYAYCPGDQLGGGGSAVMKDTPVESFQANGKSVIEAGVTVVE